MKKLLVLAALVATAGSICMAIAPAGAAPSTKKFCNANWKISQVFNTLPQDPKPGQIEQYQAKIDSLLDQAEPVAPADIAPQVTAAAAILHAGIQSAFSNPTLQDYGQQIDAWAFDNCGYQTVDVHATEYHFAGIPKKLKPGRTIVKLTNDGAEVHQIGVAHIKTNTPVKTLIANEKRAEKETEFLGGAFATQGQTSFGYVNLKDGRTVAICFIPVGTTDPNTEVHGPPHASKGMVQEFKVA